LGSRENIKKVFSAAINERGCKHKSYTKFYKFSKKQYECIERTILFDTILRQACDDVLGPGGATMQQTTTNPKEKLQRVSSADHRLIRFSLACNEAGEARYNFMTKMISLYPKLSYLSNKPDKSRMARPLSPELSRKIWNYFSLYAGHFPPESQGRHGYIHEVTCAATCETK
jgi:hypothetical protein